MNDLLRDMTEARDVVNVVFINNVMVGIETEKNMMILWKKC